MINQNPIKSFFTVWITLCIAFILTILPLSGWILWIRPQWVLLILFFWVVNTDGKIGLGTTFVAGIFLDLLTGTLLGQHSIIFCLLIYIMLKINPRFRFFPLYQQTIIVLFLVWLNLVLNMGLMNFTGKYIDSSLYWLSAFLTALIWPFLSQWNKQKKNTSFSLHYN